MKLNRELMENTIAELKENKRFLNSVKKLERCEKINKAVFAGDVASTIGTVASGGVLAYGVISTLTNDINYEALTGGAIAFCASVGADALVRDAQQYMAGKEERARECVYANIRSQYVNGVNALLNGVGTEYLPEDFDMAVEEYEKEAGKSFDMADFDISLDFER